MQTTLRGGTRFIARDEVSSSTEGYSIDGGWKEVEVDVGIICRIHEYLSSTDRKEQRVWLPSGRGKGSRGV